MKRKILNLLILVFLVAFVGGCGTTKANVDSKDTKESDVKETTTEESTQKKSSSTADISTDWKNCQLEFEGQLFQIPFDYSNLEATGWTFNLADYGYADGYILNKGDKAYGTIKLQNDTYDSAVTIGIQNTSETAKDIKQCQVWSIGVVNTRATNPVSFNLPAGITSGSTVDEIKAAYGEPYDTFRSDDLGYWVYTYYNDYKQKLKLTIYDDKGLMEFTYELYN